MNAKLNEISTKTSFKKIKKSYVKISLIIILGIIVLAETIGSILVKHL